MQVSVEKTSPTECVLTISVPATRIEEKVSCVVAKTVKTVRIDGFRKGKVPAGVVKKRYGQDIRMEVIKQIMRDAYVEALQKESIQPASMPSIEPKNVNEDTELEFVAKVEVYPEITLADTSAITVKRISSKVTDDDVDTMLETLRKQNVDWSVVERKSTDGDQVTINFIGYLGDEVFEGGSAYGYKLILGSNTMVPGFETSILGVKAGEERTISVTFPKDYQVDNLKGKEVTFEITVSEVAEQIIPELNDVFVEKLGLKEATVDTLRTEVRKNMARALNQAIKSKLKNSLFDVLLSINSDIQVPSALVEQEMNTLRKQATQQSSDQDFDAAQLSTGFFQEKAIKRAKLGLLISEVIKQYELKVENDRVYAFLEDMAQSYQKPQQIIDYYLKNREQLSQVQSTVLEEQVVDKLLETVQIVDVTLGYEDAIKPENQV